MNSGKKKLSFCTICLNNESQLKRTLSANLLENKEYDNLEFIVLDCNKTIGLEMWMRSTLMEYIETGKLNYIRLTDPRPFEAAYARNILMKSANGEIVCFIDACNYTGHHFAHYVNDIFLRKNNITLSSVPLLFHEPTHDHPPGYMLGILCIKKEDLIAINGFDERMIKFGNEDIDLVNRLRMRGLREELISNPMFNGFIKRKPGRGLCLSKILDNVSRIYIRHCTPSLSEVLFLYQDHCFEKGTLFDHATASAAAYWRSLESRTYEYRYDLTGIENRGKWKEFINEESIRFTPGIGNEFYLKTRNNSRYDVLEDGEGATPFHAVDDPIIIEKLLTLNCIFYNTKIMEENRRNQLEATVSTSF